MTDSIKNRPMYRFLLLLTVSSTIGLQAWRTLFNNFAVEVAKLNGADIGVIQSVREVPGFLSLLAVYVLLLLKEQQLAALSVLILGVGVGLTGLFPTLAGLTVTTLIMSFGFHYYETMNQSLTLQYFDQGTAPVVFGRQRSAAAAANIAVGLLIFLMASIVSYRNQYLLIGTGIAVAGLWGFFKNPSSKGGILQHRKMILRRKYWLFYFLTFMSGARRQIFVAFAVFLMVEHFSFGIQEITLLFVVNNLINYFLSPLIGRAIVRFGERRVLSLEYLSLIFIFSAYALTTSKLVVAALYVLDHIFFNFAIAIRTYFQKIGDPKDISPSMAVGFTINHIAAVVLPAVGGVLWMVDYRIPFAAGAVMSLISLLAAQWIPSQKKSL